MSKCGYSPKNRTNLAGETQIISSSLSLWVYLLISHYAMHLASNRCRSVAGGYAFVIRNVFCVYMPARNRLALYVKSFSSGLVTIQLSFKWSQTEQYPSVNGPRGRAKNNGWRKYSSAASLESVLDVIMNITHPKPLKWMDLFLADPYHSEQEDPISASFAASAELKQAK